MRMMMLQKATRKQAEEKEDPLVLPGGAGLVPLLTKFSDD